MDKARIQDFKRLYELEHFGETLQMTSKADMMRSFEKLLGRPPRDAQEGVGSMPPMCGGFSPTLITRHHLLRCTNEACPIAGGGIGMWLGVSTSWTVHFWSASYVERRLIGPGVSHD
jgi:hypothetical protein